MNKQECDVLKELKTNRFENQRILAENCGYSLGAVNKSLRTLKDEGFIGEDYSLTTKAESLLEEKKPRNAIIMAAGFGMRMVPINLETPKALIEINGESLIERLINQLHEVGIFDITVVVGFLKERFEYLIDEYGVELVVNGQYAIKNNLHTVSLVEKHIENTYILPCDIWCAKNPFNNNELYSWYMVSDDSDPDSNVKVSRKERLIENSKYEDGNRMIGISYLTGNEAVTVRERLKEYDNDKKYDNSFWEQTLFDKDESIVYAKLIASEDAVEINTYEQLREIDENSNHLKNDAIKTIAEVLSVDESEVTNITVLKKGMTNRSFLFTCKDERYIMRIPGEGTDQLINRKNEAAVYTAINDLKICDEIFYICPENGYKITKYLENVRVCDSECRGDLVKCMKKLKDFHALKVKVGHRFDVFERIEFYESLREGQPSIYKDYPETKKKVMSLKKYIDGLNIEESLTHIDAVPDNFLIDEKNEKIYLIDWEYSSMQDPHMDIAMFCIYSLYNRKQADELIDIYFEDNCSEENRTKIYCYIAMCGLLWSNWCEYKSCLGVEFGEYSLRQYRYAKDFYKIVAERGIK